MVKIQTRTRKNGSKTHVVAIPEEFRRALDWSLEQRLALCPCKDGALKLVPIR